MSLLERIDSVEGGEEIQQGKRLIRVGDDTGVTLAQRLAYRLQQLAWRSALPGMRRRQPLKIVAVPKDPVAGDKAVGEALLAGEIVHGGETVQVEELDFAAPGLSPAMWDYLQGFGWLRDLAAAATRERSARLAETIVQRWLAADGDNVHSPAWRPDLWGRRILFWTAYAPYILSSRDADYRALVLGTLARGSRHLERTADRAPAGLPRVAAWAGVIGSAMVVQGGSARLGHGEAGLARALAGAMHEDGGLASRSPTEQLMLVEIFGQLRAIYNTGRRDMPERVQEAMIASVGALLAVVLGDEALSSWQGGNMLSKRRVAAAIEGSAVDTRSLRHARGWGYQRLAAKSSLVVLDGAPPPSSRAFAGGCASTLAFEFSDGPNRLVVNCGGVGPWTGALPARLVHALRYTAAHSTLTLADRNSTAILADGTLGRGVGQVEVSRDEAAGASRVEASHDGYVRRLGLVHERQLVLSGDGRELRGEDNLLPRKRRRGATAVPFAVRFHLAPEVEVTSTADGQGALLRVRDATAWQFRCRGGALTVEDSIWIDGLGRARPTSQLIISGEAPPDGTNVSWQFRHAG
jgi:uncharacterized heparinase superfamily protein